MPTQEQIGHQVDLPEAIRAKMEASFGADVEIGALLPAGSGGSFSARLADLTAGGAMFEEEGSVFRPQKI